MGNKATDDEIVKTMNAIRKSVKQFETKDRKRVLRAAASVVVREARNKTEEGSRTTLIYKRRGPRRVVRKRTNRKSKNKEVKNVGARGGRLSSSYVVGNLRRSVAAIVFRGSPDVFVGAKFRKGGINAGTSVKNASGFYADFAYGGTGQFKRRVLAPAAQRKRAAAVEAMRKKALTAFRGRFKKQGLKTA